MAIATETDRARLARLERAVLEQARSLVTLERAVVELQRAQVPQMFVQIAAVYALEGQAATPLDELDHAYAAGARDGRTVAIDPFFRSVHSKPRFTHLLSRITSDVAAMRARADFSGLPWIERSQC